MTTQLFIAVDLGASSGRVFLARISTKEFSLEEIHRYQYPPRSIDGNLRWDFWHIFDEIKSGLQRAAVRANQLELEIRSIGVDSWGVDYGLIDENGNLIADPICYRDDRTSDAMAEVFERVSRQTIFEKTGIQFQNFNTLYQLWTERESLSRGSKLLLMPDLVNFFLTGHIAAEFTNATTTQMVNASSGMWDLDLIEALDLPARVLPDIIPAGTDLGPLRSEIAAELDLHNVRVIAPATHDTGSAVAAAPISQNWSYISSGTWSLIGVENDEAVISDEVARQNFTNEGGAYGTVRFLKNVMGLWLFESCRREWMSAGIDVGYEAVMGEVSERQGFPALIFPDDARFLNPPSMLGAITEQLRETGQKFEDVPSMIAKIIFDSLAFRYASVLRSIETLTGRQLEGVQILGGGSRNAYLNQMTASASGMKVKAGLPEATAVGNILVQAISAGRFASLSEARQHVAESFGFEEYMPLSSPELVDAADQYAEIECRFIS
jgi:rhamnulokinase